jgi:hypothetical protein
LEAFSAAMFNPAKKDKEALLERRGRSDILRV